MSIIIPDTEDIEKLQKRFSEALGDEYQVEMYTEVSSSFFFSKKNVFDLVIFRNNIPFVNGSLKFEITAKRLYAASQRVL